MTTSKRKGQHKPASASKRNPAPTRKEKPATARGRREAAAAALAAIALGEDSTRQFKRDITNPLRKKTGSRVPWNVTLEGVPRYYRCRTPGCSTGQIAAEVIEAMSDVAGKPAAYQVRTNR